jgi:hypothetical protein
VKYQVIIKKMGVSAQTSWNHRRKVSLKPFQRLVASRRRNGGRSPQRAKLLKRRFSFANFSLCAFRAKEKSGQQV